MCNITENHVSKRINSKAFYFGVTYKVLEKISKAISLKLNRLLITFVFGIPKSACLAKP